MREGVLTVTITFLQQAVDLCCRVASTTAGAIVAVPESETAQ
jgi:hypothetical protein